MAQHNHISAIVTTAGGIEEDLIKCLGDTYMGAFSTPGAELRSKGLNRIGNLIVPNNNYCAFEDWVVPILDAMLAEQKASKAQAVSEEDELIWSPSTIIDRLGKEINNESSVLYWCHKNKIPVFCPGLTDGSLGDMLYFHSFKASPSRLLVDINQDIRKINTIAVRAKRAGMIILGGGIVKHHIANACLMRNGAESAVYINTAQEFDGSDAGARPDEAVSWGKIKVGADSVKVGLSCSSSLDYLANILGLFDHFLRQTHGWARKRFLLERPTSTEWWSRALAVLHIQTSISRRARKSSSIYFHFHATLTCTQVYVEATACFPLIVAATFAKDARTPKPE